MNVLSRVPIERFRQFPSCLLVLGVWVATGWGGEMPDKMTQTDVRFIQDSLEKLNECDLRPPQTQGSANPGLKVASPLGFSFSATLSENVIHPLG